ncbi:hypothetical protein [Wolbachia endosymbiont (group A) of Anomoia purmunda]|uniref:hypothetical protein n=1 Tax=Wolbachia endosymbiont (group A) of Anomoia purmunda TaxID=2953978 RepID=UPI002232B949|nr:hypothetical protein [Wolbachia endosymbiont (group A) of Anomoia purmunda]
MVGAGLLLSSLLAISLIATLLTSGFKDSSKEIAQAIAYTGIRFGIGAGFVALGFTSPAAIGALAALAGSIAYIPFKLLIDKAMPDTSMEIDGIDAGYWYPEVFGNPLPRR